MVALRLPARLRARQQWVLALVVFAAATCNFSVGLFGSAEDVPTPHRCRQRGSIAFAWPNRPMKKGRGPTKRSKKNLLTMLRDDDVLISKTHWVIGLMHKYKFWRTSWEYNLGMKKLIRVGAWYSALELWDHMKAKGIESEGATYSFAVCACMAGRKWEHALALWEEMELNSRRPLRIGAEQGLMACEKGGLWEKALTILDGMWERGQAPNEDTFKPVIRACENAGRYDVGDKVFWDMRRQTKLAKREEEREDRLLPQPREAPKAKPAPWRLPGAVALDAYDTPKQKILESRKRENGKSKEEDTDEQADLLLDEPQKPWKHPIPFRTPLAKDGKTAQTPWKPYEYIKPTSYELEDE